MSAPDSDDIASAARQQAAAAVTAALLRPITDDSNEGKTIERAGSDIPHAAGGIVRAHASLPFGVRPREGALVMGDDGMTPPPAGPDARLDDATRMIRALRDEHLRMLAQHAANTFLLQWLWRRLMAAHPAPGAMAAQVRADLTAMLARMADNGTTYDDVHRARIAEAVAEMVRPPA